MKLTNILLVVTAVALTIVGLDWLDTKTGKHSRGGTPQTEETPITSHIAVARGFVDVEGGIVKLASSQSALIVQVLVKEGEQVTKGQALARLDDRAAHLQLKVIQAEYEHARLYIRSAQLKVGTAEREYRRAKKLAPKGTVSRKSVDALKDQFATAKSELAEKQAGVETANTRLHRAAFDVEQHVVRAPSDGHIVRRFVRPGDGASTLNVTTMFWFAPKRPRIIRAELEEQYVGAVKQGMKALIFSEAERSKCFKASVTRLGTIFGPKRPDTYDPKERADVRVIEIVLAPEQKFGVLLLGQRVLVRLLRNATDADPHSGCNTGKSVISSQSLPTKKD